MTITGWCKRFMCFARRFVVFFLLYYSMAFEGVFFEGFRPNIKLGLCVLEVK